MKILIAIVLLVMSAVVGVALQQIVDHIKKTKTKIKS